MIPALLRRQGLGCHRAGQVRCAWFLGPFCSWWLWRKRRRAQNSRRPHQTRASFTPVARRLREVPGPSL